MMGYTELLEDVVDSVESLVAIFSVVEGRPAAEYGVVDTPCSDGGALLSVLFPYRGRGPENAVVPKATRSKISCRPNMLILLVVSLIIILLSPKTSFGV